MGMLDGGLQQMFGAAFGTLLLEGRHYHRTETRNDAGDVTGVVTKAQSFHGYREITSNTRKPDEGSSNTLRMLVLQTYDGRVLDPIARGDVLSLDGQRMVVGDWDEDPAHTHWLVRGAPE